MSKPSTLRLLGTGTSQGIPVIGCNCEVCTSTDPRDTRLRTSALIQTKGKGILIDIGPDFRQQMLAGGLHDVHAILITHEHNDHVMGLDDIRPINYFHQRAIPMYGLKGALHEIRKRFPYAFDPDYIYPGKPNVHAIEIEDRLFEVEGIKILPVPATHGDIPVLGFRFDDVAYMTDVKTLSAESRKRLEGLDILVINGLRQKWHPTHLNWEEVFELVEDLKPRLTYMTHISHDMGTTAKAEVKLPPGVHLGYDGMEIQF